MSGRVFLGQGWRYGGDFRECVASQDLRDWSLQFSYLCLHTHAVSLNITEGNSWSPLRVCVTLGFCLGPFFWTWSYRSSPPSCLPSSALRQCPGTYLSPTSCRVLGFVSVAGSPKASTSPVHPHTGWQGLGETVGTSPSKSVNHLLLWNTLSHCYPENEGHCSLSVVSFPAVFPQPFRKELADKPRWVKPCLEIHNECFYKRWPVFIDNSRSD